MLTPVAVLSVWIFRAADGLSVVHSKMSLKQATNRSNGESDLDSDTRSKKVEWEPFPIFGPTCSKNNTEVPCFDPAQCVPGTAKRPAITFAFDLAIEWTKGERDARRFRKAARQLGAALILMIPAKGALDETNAKKIKLSRKTRKRIQKYYDIVEVPWVTPPNLSEGVPREGGCCGAREFMKLHSVGMDQFDAVINLDNDMNIASLESIPRLRQLFDCAASGMMLTTRGSTSSVNGAFFAVQPQKQLLNEMLSELETAHVANNKEAWNGYGWGPNHKEDDFRIQGFFEYLFYLRGSQYVRAEQLQPCKISLQGYCAKAPCNATVFHHHGKCYDNTGVLVGGPSK